MSAARVVYQTSTETARMRETAYQGIFRVAMAPRPCSTCAMYGPPTYCWCDECGRVGTGEVTS